MGLKKVDFSARNMRVNVNSSSLKSVKDPFHTPGSGEFHPDLVSDGASSVAQSGPAGASTKSRHNYPANNNLPEPEPSNSFNSRKVDRHGRRPSRPVSTRALANAIKEILGPASTKAHHVKEFSEAERADLREELVPDKSASEADIVAARNRLAEFATVYNRLHTAKMKFGMTSGGVTILARRLLQDSTVI